MDQSGGETPSYSSPMKRAKKSPVKSPMKSPMKRPRVANDENFQPTQDSFSSPQKKQKSPTKQGFDSYASPDSKENRKSYERRRMKEAGEEPKPTENLATGSPLKSCRKSPVKRMKELEEQENSENQENIETTYVKQNSPEKLAEKDSKLSEPLPGEKTVLSNSLPKSILG